MNGSGMPLGNVRSLPSATTPPTPPKYVACVQPLPKPHWPVST